MGFSKMMQGDLTGADPYYARLVKSGSEYPYLWAQMSELEVKRKNFEKAVELATAGYDRHKSDSKLAADDVTQILIAYDDFPGDHRDEMEKWQSKRTELRPDVAWFWGDHARFRLYFMFDYEGAIKYGTKALSLMRYGMGESYLAAAYFLKWALLKDAPTTKADAEKAFQSGREIDPSGSSIDRFFYYYPVLRPAREQALARLKSDGKTLR